jgi:hypothetical protein
MVGSVRFLHSSSSSSSTQSIKAKKKKKKKSWHCCCSVGDPVISTHHRAPPPPFSFHCVCVGLVGFLAGLDFVRLQICSEGLPGQAGKGGWWGGINSKEGEQVVMVVVCIS